MYPIGRYGLGFHFYGKKQDANHFLMMNRPDEFNKALQKAILILTDN